MTCEMRDNEINSQCAEPLVRPLVYIREFHKTGRQAFSTIPVGLK